MDVRQKIVGVTDLIAALAGPRQADEDFNKRHTMSHPPEHIPDMEHIDEKAKPVKEPKKKEEKLKDKVINYMFVFYHLKAVFVLFYFQVHAISELFCATDSFPLMPLCGFEGSTSGQLSEALQFHSCYCRRITPLTEALVIFSVLNCADVAYISYIMLMY